MRSGLTQRHVSSLLEACLYGYGLSLFVGSTALNRVAFVVALLAWLWRLVGDVEFRRDLAKLPVFWLALGLFATSTLATQLTPEAREGSRHFYGYEFTGPGLLFGLFLSAMYIDARRGQRVLLTAVVALVAIIAVHGLQMWHASAVVDMGEEPYAQFWQFRDRAEALNLLLPFALAAGFSTATGQWLRIAVLTAFLAGTLALLPTAYRGAWLGFPPGMLAWAILRPGWLMAVAGAVAGAIATPWLIHRDNAIETARVRVGFMSKPALGYIAEWPWTGCGFGRRALNRTKHANNYRDRYGDTNYDVFTDAHNKYLGYAFSAGIPGATLYGFWVLSAIVLLLRIALSDQHEWLRVLALAAAASWIAIFGVDGLTDIVRWDYLGILLPVTLAVIISQTRLLQRARHASRYFFLIRDKMGDSLIAFATVQAFRRRHPTSTITVLMRSDYANLVEGEPGVRLIHYRGFGGTWFRLAVERLAGSSYEALVVLRGFGPRTATLARLVRARRKIHFNGRWSAVLPEFPPDIPPQEMERTTLLEYSLRAARMLDPELPIPVRLEMPRLRTLRAERRHSGVVVCPETDEARKNLGTRTVTHLLEIIRRELPDEPVRILVRDSNRLAALASLPDVELYKFSKLNKLEQALAGATAFYGADSGPFHLAVAMGVPATVLFGPTQPGIVILPQQGDTRSLRIKGLDDDHCPVKSCRDPVCIEHAARLLAGSQQACPLERAPPSCPLRRMAPEQLDAVAIRLHGPATQPWVIS